MENFHIEKPINTVHSENRTQDVQQSRLQALGQGNIYFNPQSVLHIF